MRIARPEPPHPRLAWLPGAVLLLVLGAAMTWNLWLVPGLFGVGGRVLDGERARAVADAYDEALPLKEAAVTLWGALEFGVFGEGRPGVLVGDDGWLYSTEEFEEQVPFSERAEFAALLARRVQEVLAPEGGTLVVAAVPDKARVCPEHLGRVTRPSSLDPRYDVLLAALRAEGVTAVDLRPALSRGKEAGAVFLRTDTHWTPHGAITAATAIAEAVPSVRGDTSWVLEFGDEVPYFGDLERFLALGALAGRLGPSPDRLGTPTARRPAQGPADAEALFGEVEIPGLLIGTSYSADARWGFESALKHALRMDFLNMSEAGRGPMAPLEAWLEGVRGDSRLPRLVVWELPERYLSIEVPTP